MSSPPPPQPSSPTLLDRLLLILAPLRMAAESEMYLRDATRSMGWDLEAGGVELPATVANLRELASEIDTLMQFRANPPQELEDYLKLLDTSAKVFEHVRDLGGVFDSAGDIDFSEFGRDLLDNLVIGSWYRYAPISFAVANLLTLVQEAPEATEIVANGSIVRHQRPRARVRFDRVGPLLRDPARLLREEYFSVNGLTDRETAFKAADRLFPRLAFLARQLGLGAHYGLPRETPIEGDTGIRDSLDHMLTIFGAPDDGPMFGATLMLSSEPGARGLIVSPFGQITFQRDFESLIFSLETSATVKGLLFGDGIELRDGGALKLRCRAESAETEEQPTTLGGDSGSGLQIGAARFEGELEITGDSVDAALGLTFDHVRLQIAPSDGDSFLSSVLPREGVNTELSLGLSWSTKHGFHFSGSAALDLTLPVQASFGPVRLDSVNLAIATQGSAIRAHVAVTGGLVLGPFAVQVDRLGLTALIEFPENGGNLGFANLDLDFKPPNGLGFSINAPTVTGGGFIGFDPDKGEYSGVLELEIAEKIAVKGIALLTTRLPGGGKGYSLVIIIFVEGFTPIQLGFGFALIGIGGMLAINRSFDEEALRAGLKSHALDSVMFPVDPVRNAPQIISNLNRLFPPASGHHLFGPMVQLAWGTPPLITADIALVLEFGTRRRLLILAQVLSVLPKPDHELVRLQMDAVGVLDFDQSTAALDATLHDSRLLNKFALTGDMAMRLSWGSSPNFALAVGGLHPAFNPPPNFPKLARISINLSSGDNPRLRCESYFALTSNTVQFGARAELFASAAGFSVHGEIGYDVLIQFDPFAFIADFHAQLQLKRGSTNLFKVELKGSLAGPRPLHIKGKATFSILWWDVSVRIDKVLVGGEKPPLPEPIDVLPRLKEALNNAANWTTKLPVSRPLVQLRADATATADVLLHPLGTLTIKQGVVPLNTTISRFGQAAPAGTNRFQITTVSLGNDNQTLAPVTDFFAPAQFIEMSDDQKLSRPSFESMEAGVAFGSEEIDFSDDAADWLEVKTIEFETWLIDDDPKVPHRSPAELPKPAQPKVFYQLSRDLLMKQALFGAAGGSALRRSGAARYRVSTVGKYQVSKEGWSIVATDDLSTVRDAANYSDAEQALEEIKRATPDQAVRFQILRLSELKSAF
ncbi:MAG TPA: DUF6603 domain-containing protein [Pyrinomonadaceae bacterium]|nr:DUF6603 domain-containing protein [Pyrinomonadaceae bacterium]